MSDMVTLTHPKLPGATYDCYPQQVDGWVALGWQKQTAKKTAAAKQAADEPTTSDRTDKPATRKEN